MCVLNYDIYIHIHMCVQKDTLRFAVGVKEKSRATWMVAMIQILQNSAVAL